MGQLGQATSGHAGLGAASNSASRASAAATLVACASSCFFVSAEMPTCGTRGGVHGAPCHTRLLLLLAGTHLLRRLAGRVTQTLNDY